MPKLTVASIRKSVSAEARAKLDQIWEHRLATNAWPTDRWIYKRLPKPKFDALLKTLNGSHLVEMDSSGVKTYEVQPIGVLCTSNGEHYLSLLRRYVDYVRHVYFDNDRQNSIKHSELIEHAGFTADETVDLGRLLYVSNIFWCRPGHAPDFSAWECHLPSDLGDVLPSDGSTNAAFETLVLRHWHPNVPISYEARARQIYGGSLALEALFDSATTGAPKRKKPIPKRTHVPAGTESKVLTASRRRCALCHGLDGILEETEGQIAHIDRNPKNARPENLVWLCFKHHNAYDSSMSQAKGYTPGELRIYRTELWRAIKRKEHLSGAKQDVAAPVPSSPYETLLKTSPRTAVEAAWKDVERAARGVLETKMTFANPAAAIPSSALMTMLRSFGGVDQENASAFEQLAAVHNALTDGVAVDEGAARAYCSAAKPVIAYLRSK